MRNTLMTSSTKSKMLALSAAIALSLCAIGEANANATSIILDGDFLQPIGTGLNLTPWSDWTNAGITRHSAPDGIQGNYASLPVGADLFQRFSTLPNGGYVLSFLVQNRSPTPAELVFAVQQGGGTPVAVVFAAGTGEELSLPASSKFMSETLTFYLDNPSFIPDELTYSNSYDNTAPPIQNSVNPSGTIINIADVTLCPLASYPCALTPVIPPNQKAVPEPATLAMMLTGLFGLGAMRRTWPLKHLSI